MSLPKTEEETVCRTVDGVVWVKVVVEFKVLKFIRILACHNYLHKLKIQKSPKERKFGHKFPFFDPVSSFDIFNIKNGLKRSNITSQTNFKVQFSD